MVDYSYAYDPMGNPAQRTEDSGVSAYTYNNLNQLVTGDWSGTLSAFGSTQTTNLDAVTVDAQTATVFDQGGWTAKGLTVPEGDTTLTVTRTATDQTTTQAQTTVTRPADATTYTHDLNGNMQGDGRWTYTWNDENRLISAEESPNVGGSTCWRLLFSYDGQGRRRTKLEHTWNAQTETWTLVKTTNYTWDNWLITQERITDHTVVPATTQSRTHTRGLDLSGSPEGAGGIGGLLAITSSSLPLGEGQDEGSTALPCYDGNGNVTELVDPATGDPVAHYEYSPFGKTLIASGPLAEANPYRFSTKEQDVTGLCYYGYRYYSPSLERWASRDPIQERGGTNLYSLCTNSPVLAVDPLGTEEWTCERMYARIRSRFHSVRDIPPAASSAEFVTPSVISLVQHTGVEWAVYVFRTKVRCQSADGTIRPTGEFYALTYPLSSQEPGAVNFVVALNAFTGAGSAKSLTHKLYGAGYASSSYLYEKPCCKCDVEMRRSSVIHGHANGGPSLTDQEFESDEKSWVIYQNPGGKWMKQAWINPPKTLYPPRGAVALWIRDTNTLCPA